MLASLELFGFKSFAERTTFQFDPGVTAVVGPNGSGKSNVVDAIKWVLGDQSAKSLRGKEMTDVIFNGATGRKPSNFAEATLTFDNASGFLPSSEAQVRVGRRLWRNGDSEYLLNDQVVRLKDVRDLFVGTGAGASAYAIIEQGRVDQILQANAVGRRAVFEEAAGISRYKAKKNDALRRLERVEQNLLRLTDIVDEVEAQLHSTRTQAAKAAAHRDLSKELERWWLGLAADDYRHASAQMTTLNDTLAEKQIELDRLAEEQAGLDGQLKEIDSELAVADEQLRSAEKASSGTRESIAGHEAAIRYQTTRLEELESDLVRLRRQVTLLSSRAAEGLGEKEHNTRVLATSEAEIANLEQALEAQESERANYLEQIEVARDRVTTLRAQHTAKQHDVSTAEQRIAALEAERETLSRAVASVEQRVASITNDLSESANHVADRALALEEADAELRLRRGRAADLHEARERLAADRERLTAEIATLREQKSATAARIAVLEDLHSRGEGFGIGVREILKRARSLKDAPWNRIYGTVADLLDVELDDAPLLEIALGERAQLIVIEDFQALIPYLGHSSSKIAGRVGFLSNQGLPSSIDSDLAGVRYIEAYPKLHTLTEDEPHHAPSDASSAIPHHSPLTTHQPTLHGLPGVIKRADELVRPSSRMPHLATRLLSDTWIVESLQTALRLAAGHGRHQRFVTLSGELLDTDGTLVVGTLRAEAAVVSRRSELLRLRSELVGIDHAIEVAQKQLETLGASQTTLTESLASTDRELRSATDRLGRAKNEHAQAEAQHRRLEASRTGFEEELENHRARHAEVTQGITSLAQERDLAKEDLGDIDVSLEHTLAVIAEAEQQQIAINKAQASIRLEIAKAEERLLGLRAAVTRIEREASQRGAQLAEAVRRLDAGYHKRSEITRHLLNTQSLLAEAALGREEFELEIRQASKIRDALKDRRGKFGKDEAAIRSRRRILSDAHHAAEMSAREIEHRLTTVAERIREEYNRDIADIAQEDYSAVSLWLEEADEKKPKPEAAHQSTEIPDNAGDPHSPHPTSHTPPPTTTLPPFAELRPQLEARVERLRKKLKMMGAVNADSLANLDELEERHSRLSGQLQDLVEAKRMLEDLIRKINVESKRLFAETFESIRGHFKELFRKLFGGGEGDIVLEDANDILECGIDIVVRPPGKELRSLSLLSGGEKTMTCVGLLLAIFKSRPSPFCLLDEVDAALDEANIGRFITVVKEFKATTQFVMITHRKPSMCEADVLYGVTMEQAGVSKRLNVRFEDVADDGSFKEAKRAA